jgi:peroxiredoxin
MAYTLELGEKAFDFDLPATDGKSYSMHSFADAELSCLYFSHAITVPM